MESLNQPKLERTINEYIRFKQREKYWYNYFLLKDAYKNLESELMGNIDTVIYHINTSTIATLPNTPIPNFFIWNYLVFIISGITSLVYYNFLSNYIKTNVLRLFEYIKVLLSVPNEIELTNDRTLLANKRKLLFLQEKLLGTDLKNNTPDEIESKLSKKFVYGRFAVLYVISNLTSYSTYRIQRAENFLYNTFNQLENLSNTTAFLLKIVGIIVLIFVFNYSILFIRELFTNNKRKELVVNTLITKTLNDIHYKLVSEGNDPVKGNVMCLTILLSYYNIKLTQEQINQCEDLDKFIQFKEVIKYEIEYNMSSLKI